MKRGKNKRNHHQNVVEGDAWTQLLIEYHKAILTAAWDFAIDLGTNWLGTGSDVVTSLFQKVIQTD